MREYSTQLYLKRLKLWSGWKVTVIIIIIHRPINSKFKFENAENQNYGKNKYHHLNVKTIKILTNNKNSFFLCYKIFNCKGQSKIECILKHRMEKDYWNIKSCNKMHWTGTKYGQAITKKTGINY